jgi:broad specificity phosphatase PhoE
VLSWPQQLRLVRHAQSIGNLAADRARAQGATRLDLQERDADVPLSDLGCRQAAALGRWLAGLDDGDRPTAVLTSPYERAARTAQIALDEAGLDLRLRTDERLRERDLGILDGLTGKGYRELYAAEAERRRRVGKLYYRPPGGESWSDVALRVRSLITTLREDHAEQRLLLVTHQAVIMSFRIVLEGLDETTALGIDTDQPLGNCSVTRYDLGERGRLELTAYDDASPLEGSEEPVTEEEPTADA